MGDSSEITTWDVTPLALKGMLEIAADHPDHEVLITPIKLPGYGGTAFWHVRQYKYGKPNVQFLVRRDGETWFLEGGPKK